MFWNYITAKSCQSSSPPSLRHPRRQSALELNKITVWHVVYGISSYDKRGSLRCSEYFVIFILNFINPATRLLHYQGCGDSNLYPTLITTKGYGERVLCVCVCVGGRLRISCEIACCTYILVPVCWENCFDPRHCVPYNAPPMLTSTFA